MNKTADPSEYLVNPERLQAELADDTSAGALRVFDATIHLLPAKTGYRAESGAADYANVHIPGAAFIDQIRQCSDTTTGLGFSRLPASALAEVFAAAGVNHDSRVVFYSSGHLMWATRAFWLAKYCGMHDVRVLNGGLRQWQSQGFQTQSVTTNYDRGNFTGEPNENLFIDKAQMAQISTSDSHCTINALSPDVYAGTGDMHYGRRGHIPGSKNLHYDDLLDAGAYRDSETLKRLLSAKGLLGEKPVVTYCGGGISATVDALACWMLGKMDVAVYDGSMSEWVRDESLPLEVGHP